MEVALTYFSRGILHQQFALVVGGDARLQGAAGRRQHLHLQLIHTRLTPEEKMENLSISCMEEF